MRKNLVLTLAGTDQIGLVEKVTKNILELNANIEASRMARLGGEFAMLMLISVPDERLQELDQSVQRLQSDGFTVTTCQTDTANPIESSGWLPYVVDVYGADQEGIIHAITGKLAELGGHVETMDTNMVKAPLSGAPLFMMNALVYVPPELAYRDLQRSLDAVGDKINVDIDVTPYKG